MEYHCDLSQGRGTLRCGSSGGPATNEKEVPRRPGSDADKGVDTPTPVKMPASSTLRINTDKKAGDQAPPADSEIWPKGPPDTD
jgi:hypothetical protein